MNAVKLLQLVASEYGVAVSEIKGKSRIKPLPEARRMAIKLLEDKLRFNPGEIVQVMQCSDKHIRSNIQLIELEIQRISGVEDHYKNLLKAIENVSKT